MDQKRCSQTWNTVGLCPKRPMCPHLCCRQRLRSLLCCCWRAVLTDVSTHGRWALMTKEQKPLCPPEDAAVTVAGQRPGQPCPALLNLLIQFVTLPAPSHPDLHSTHAHPVRVSAWHSGSLQARAPPCSTKAAVSRWMHDECGMSGTKGSVPGMNRGHSVERDGAHTYCN